MEYEGPERRKNIRVGLGILVSYAVVDDPQKQNSTSAEDISDCGMKLPIREKLGVGARLKLQIELVKDKKTAELEAKVIWVKPTHASREFPFEAGLEFINLDLATRALISNCIYYNIDALKKAAFEEE